MNKKRVLSITGALLALVSLLIVGHPFLFVGTNGNGGTGTIGTDLLTPHEHEFHAHGDVDLSSRGIPSSTNSVSSSSNSVATPP